MELKADAVILCGSRRYAESQRKEGKSIGLNMAEIHRLAQGNPDRRYYGCAVRPLRYREHKSRRDCRTGWRDAAGLEWRHLQHDSQPFRQRNPAHRRCDPRHRNDHGADSDHYGQKQHARRSRYLVHLQVGVQNGLCGTHCQQHLGYRYGRIRCGAERGQQCFRRCGRQCQP